MTDQERSFHLDEVEANELIGYARALEETAMIAERAARKARKKAQEATYLARVAFHRLEDLKRAMTATEAAE